MIVFCLFGGSSFTAVVFAYATAVLVHSPLLVDIRFVMMKTSWGLRSKASVLRITANCSYTPSQQKRYYVTLSLIIVYLCLGGTSQNVW